MQKLFAHVDQNLASFIDGLKEFLRLQSISADPDKKADCAATAEWLAARISDIGFRDVDVIMMPHGHPLVYAYHPGPKGAPTVLLYGHYDVQPVDPVELWTCPPFEPCIKDGKIWARGATDDKGQIWLHLKALETLFKVNGGLPVSVKLIFEGEEEMGSESITAWLPEHADMLACDVIVVSDSSMLAKGQPSINYGLRGLAYFQIDMEAANGDLHSGTFGGAVANPINVLAELLAKLHDADNRVTIPGFYDDVLPISAEEKANYAKLPEGTEELLASTGAPRAFGETGFTTAQRTSARPTLDANGIWGGFAGEGAKTVLPAKAGAKVSMRLVPNQDLKKVTAAFRKHVEKLAPDAVRIKVTEMHGGRWFMCPLTEPAIVTAAAALKEVFGKECLFTREGGSIPIVADMAAIMKKPVVLMGFGLNSEQAHAPNEHLDLENFHLGIKTALVYLNKLGK
jgi:acetylornithine deacetylase/succinyl-diaminopimelate desuccinylase-like protein